MRVAPNRMGASRRGERQPGKSDQIDSLAIARAVVKDGVESFPVAYLDEQAMEIRLLFDHRNDLVVERTRVINRLRWHLLALCPELERSLKRGSLNQSRVLDRVDRRLRQLGTSARVRVAREQVARIRSLNGQIDALKRELRALVEAHRPELLAEVGCGELTASILIGRTAGAERFKSDASFALQDFSSNRAPFPTEAQSAAEGLQSNHTITTGTSSAVWPGLAGIAAADRISPHSLHHSFATELLGAGETLQDVQDAMGHADARTARAYDRSRHNLDRHPTYAMAANLSRIQPSEESRGPTAE